MDSVRRTEVIVGATVLIAVIILIAGVYWGKGERVLASRQWLTVRFEDVRGLEVGDPVFVRGIKKGQVEAIQLGSTYAEVRLWIMKDVPVYSDLRFSLTSRELMGGIQIVLYPGVSNQPADVDRVYEGEAGTGIDAFVHRADLILRRADSLFVYLNRFARQETLESVVGETELAMRTLRSTVSENRLHVRNTLARLDSMTLEIEAQSFPTRLSSLMTQLDSTTTLMHSVVSRMEKEEGTVGKLLRDRWLYDQLLETSLELDSLITDLRANPKKYVKFSLF